MIIRQERLQRETPHLQISRDFRLWTMYLHSFLVRGNSLISDLAFAVSALTTAGKEIALENFGALNFGDRSPHQSLRGPRTTAMSPSATTSTVTDIREEVAATSTTVEDVELSTAKGYDDEQIRLMEEVCIVIDENDQPLRPGTKKECTHPSSE